MPNPSFERSRQGALSLGKCLAVKGRRLTTQFVDQLAQSFAVSNQGCSLIGLGFALIGQGLNRSGCARVAASSVPEIVPSRSGLARFVFQLKVEALLRVRQFGEIRLEMPHFGDALFAEIAVIAHKSVGIGIRALTEQLFDKVIA